MQPAILMPGCGHPYAEGAALDHTAPLVFTVGGVLSADECARTIARIDALGPTEAPITTAAGFVRCPEERNNERVMFDDHAFARDLFARLAPALPARLCGMRAVGANERFRCYRYAPGQRFRPHFDGAFARDRYERSLLTLIVYLNEGFEGGHTRFGDGEHDVDVAPRTGMALLFQHYLLHEGCEVTRGTKYVLRSDVMYRSGAAPGAA